MRTSKADTVLSHVESVIVDEIHTIAGTKRESDLFSTLERLERLRAGKCRVGTPLSSISLTANLRTVPHPSAARVRCDHGHRTTFLSWPSPPCEIVHRTRRQARWQSLRSLVDVTSQQPRSL